MSAFILDDLNFDAILYKLKTCCPNNRFYCKGKQYDLINDINYLGYTLKRQNYASVNFRYKEDTQPTYYNYKPYMRPLSFEQAIKICDCYNYQACETPDYDTTLAYAIITGIKAAFVYELLHTLPAYNEAAWGV